MTFLKSALLATLAAAPLAFCSTPQKAVSAEPREVLVVEGTPLRLSDVTLEVRAILYAHLTRKDGTSDNESRCTVTVRRGAQSAELQFDRLHSEPPAYQRALGLELALQAADPYQSPGRAQLLVRAAADAGTK